MLIVGATKILRPAVTELLRDGSKVMGFARTKSDLDTLKAQSGSGFDFVAVDYTDVAALASVARTLPKIDAALIYAPGASVESSLIFRDLVDGPVVEILGSSAARENPDLPFTADQIIPTGNQPWITLVLGWTVDKKWHSAEQISQRAIEVLKSEVNGTLGALRPWTDRPIQCANPAG